MVRGIRNVRKPVQTVIGEREAVAEAIGYDREATGAVVGGADHHTSTGRHGLQSSAAIVLFDGIILVRERKAARSLLQAHSTRGRRVDCVALDRETHPLPIISGGVPGDDARGPRRGTVPK